MEETASTSANIKQEYSPKKKIPKLENMGSFVVDDTATLVPVEIEELDRTDIDQMNLNMGEFVEAEAIKLDQIPAKLSISSVKYVDGGQSEETASDTDDQSVLSVEEENLLTKQFLNGELTFSEFTVRMDQDADIEQEEAVASNVDEQVPMTETNNQQIAENNEKSIKSRPKRVRRNLPPALQGLMGEANLRYAKGQVELATQMCMEIIRQVPNAPEPFLTLSMIYENDQPDKAMQFALIAAHLSPRNPDQWIRLANSSLEAGNLRQALTCYSKAIQASPKNIEFYEIRARLQDQYGDKKAFIRAYSKMLHQLGPEDGINIVKYAKLLTERCMPENMYETALEGMDNVFKKCPQLVGLEEVNVMTELLILLKQYVRCLSILTNFTRISVKYSEPMSHMDPKPAQVVSCNIPDDLAVDLKAKCIISLIELEALDIANQLVPRFQELEDVEVSGDLFLDIAESYMGHKQYLHALKLLEPLVASDNFSLAAVWLRHAECWVGCGQTRRAIESYEVVRKLSPQHLGARMELSRLYEVVNKIDMAIEVLRQEPELELLDPAVLLRRTELLGRCNRHKEYFEAGLLLLSRHCLGLRSREELVALSRASGVKQRVDIIQRNRLSRGEPLLDESAPSFACGSTGEPSEEHEFSLVLDMCARACDLKKYGLLQRICFTALTSRRFAQRNHHLLYLCLISCIRNTDSFAGFNIVREIVRAGGRSAVPWNLLNIIIQKATDSRHSRFIMRQLSNENVFSFLHILHANNCLVSGTYKYALNDYISLFKVRPSPLLALLISVTLLQMACQKFSSKKNQLVAQALAFMKTYAKLRGQQGRQESDYNMGRALHQLGLLPGAVSFYKRVLESPQPELVRQNENLLDLKREAAFNLHLIYMQSGNTELARMYIEDYIVV